MGVKFNPFTGNLDLIDTTAAAGADTQVQFNNGGSLAGSTDLTWDDTGKELGVGGDINLDDGGTYTTTLQTITPTAARTISFPDATGTVGLVGGSSGQLVYNNAGAYAGAPSTSVGTTGNITLSLAGADSTPPLKLTGTWFTTGGTSTTTKPQLLIEPSDASSTAWSPDGTGLGVNAASGFAGNLLDLQVNGSSKLYVNKDGNIAVPAGSQSAPSISVGTTDNGLYSPDADQVAISTNGTGRLFVDASGDVGVGVASPNALLHAGLTNTAGAPTTGTVALFENNATGSNCYIQINGAYDAEAGVVFTDGSQLNKGRILYNNNSEYMEFWTDGSERLRITSDGKVGLGTSTPDSLFNVRAGANNAAAEEIASFSRPDAAVRAAISKGLISGTTNGMAIGTTTSHAFAINTSGTERLYIAQSGELGVGTTSPSYLLDVRRSSAGDVVAFTGSTDGGRPLKFISADNGIYLGAQWTRDIGSSDGIHAWASNGIERARIDSSGRLLVGTSTSSDAKAKLTVAGSVNVAAGSGNSVIIAAGATSTIATPVRGYSYINISSGNSTSRGLLLLVFADTSTLTIVSTVDDRTSAEYSASVSGRNLQVTNALGIGITLYASCMTLAWGTDG